MQQVGDRHVFGSLALCYIVALVFINACIVLYDAFTVVDVYRLIQYDISGAPFGSRAASLNHHVGSSLSAHGSDLSRTVVMLYLRELDETFIREYIEQGKPLGGLLIVLPQGFRYDKYQNLALCDYTEAKKQLADLEQKLIHRAIQYPVYFAFECQDLAIVLADIRKNDAFGQPATATIGRHKLMVTSPAPKKLASPTIINIQGWLLGMKTDQDSSQLPTIAILASYDTFGAAPAISVGSDSNGSGVVALLEIARLFSILYSNPNTRGSYNIFFGLTSGGPYNYYGTEKWLRSFNQSLRESIDYAICLISLSSAKNGLWLHVSKPPGNAYVKKIFEGLSNVAEEFGLKVGLKYKRINVSDSRVGWEHEQFSWSGVTAATLSGISVAPNLLENTGGISDKSKFVDEEAVVQSIKLVSESLARHIYGKDGKNISIFADKSRLAISPTYVLSWLSLLSETPRVAPFLSKDNTFIMALEKELADHVVEVKLQHNVIDDMFTFYDSTVNTLWIYQVPNVTFDLLLLLVVGLYFAALLSSLLTTRNQFVWSRTECSGDGSERQNGFRETTRDHEGLAQRGTCDGSNPRQIHKRITRSLAGSSLGLTFLMKGKGKIASDYHVNQIFCAAKKVAWRARENKRELHGSELPGFETRTTKNDMFSYGVGEVEVLLNEKTRVIPCVNYVPSLKNKNVLSLDLLKKQGYEVVFDGDVCYVNGMFEEENSCVNDGIVDCGLWIVMRLKIIT
ncbi:hypothetical protein R6Q57_010505 [Mikania cordata]